MRQSELGITHNRATHLDNNINMCTSDVERVHSTNLGAATLTGLSRLLLGSLPCEQEASMPRAFLHLSPVGLHPKNRLILRDPRFISFLSHASKDPVSTNPSSSLMYLGIKTGIPPQIVHPHSTTNKFHISNSHSRPSNSRLLKRERFWERLWARVGGWGFTRGVWRWWRRRNRSPCWWADGRLSFF